MGKVGCVLIATFFCKRIGNNLNFRMFGNECKVIS